MRERLKIMTKSISDIVSLTELTRHFHVSRPTVMNYISLGMPYVTKADRAAGLPWEFSKSECDEWIHDQDEIKQQKANDKFQEQKEDAGIIAARIKKLEVETERLHLRLSKERGEVVPIDDVAEIVENQMTVLRTHLLALPIKLAPILSGHTDTKYIQDTIKSYIREALEELAEDAVMEHVLPDMSEDTVHEPSKPDPLSVILGIEDDVDES